MPCLIHTESDTELPPNSKDSIHSAVAPSLPIQICESTVFRWRMNNFQLRKYGAEDGRSAVVEQTLRMLQTSIFTSDFPEVVLRLDSLQ